MNDCKEHIDMKKIFLASAVIALALTSCNHEPEFDGFQEYQPGNVVKLQLSYGGTYTGSNGFNMGEDNPENPTAVAKVKIEEWMNKTYYSAEKGSEATIKYNLINKETEISEVVGFDATFEGNITIGNPTNIPGWTNFMLEGTSTWADNSYNGNNYTQCGNVKENTTTWLISPKTSIAKGDKLSFDACVGYYNGNVLSVLISTDYVGAASKSNLSKATWTDVTAKFSIPTEPAKGFGTLGNVGVLDLSDYVGKSIYVAFKYVGTPVVNTTFQLYNIKVAREVSTTTTETIVKEARAVVNGDDSKWTVTLPSEIAEVVLNADFEEGKAYDKVMTEGWLNGLIQGTYNWEYRTFGGNLYLNLSANKHEGVLENWLVTPKLNLAQNMVLKFDLKLGYYNKDAMTLMISEDFNGEPSNITTATWTDLTSKLNIDKSSTGGYDANWQKEQVDLSAYTGKKVYIAFKYLGNGTKGDDLATTTYQIDNVYVGIPK